MTDARRLNEYAALIHQWARDKGFWDHERLVVRDPVQGDVEGRPANPSIIPEKLMLIVTEVSEVMEGYRDDDMKNVAEELVDIIIRVLDLCAFLKVDIDVEIIAKMAKNEVRPHLHGRAH